MLEPLDEDLINYCKAVTCISRDSMIEAADDAPEGRENSILITMMIQLVADLIVVVSKDEEKAKHNLYYLCATVVPLLEQHYKRKP